MFDKTASLAVIVSSICSERVFPAVHQQLFSFNAFAA
jgi:hypothetical protein